jgi:hypothetical protein
MNHYSYLTADSALDLGDVEYPIGAFMDTDKLD